MPRGYLSSETTVHFMNYHFVWCPKYRRKVIIGRIEERLKELIKEKAKELGCEIIALETMPDHVHLFIQAPPTIAPNRIIAGIKGYTSRILRQEFPEQKKKLVELKKKEDKYINAVHSQVLQDAVLRLDKAFQSYFSGLSKFPRFKRKGRYNSFTYPQHRIGFKLIGNRIKLGMIGKIKIR